MDDFVLSKYWCIKGCSELQEYQLVTLENTSNLALNNREYYYYNNTIDLNPKRWKYENFIPFNYTEITFEQFKKYVLNQDYDYEEVAPPEDLSYLVKILNDYNIK